MHNLNNNMATFIGSTYLPQKQRQDTNFPLLAQVMQMKQGKYDANRAKIQQTLDAFGIQAQQVLRDEDKEYIAAKLTDVTNQINDFGSRDLSDMSITQDITGAIRTAARDPFIQSAIQNTQKYNNFQQQVAKLKEKNPELYTDTNYEYSISNSGLKEYMAGEKNDIGDLNYIPFSDYNKKIDENVIDLLGKKKSQKVEIIGAEGQIIERTIDGLSPEQLRNVAISMLSPQDMQQIQIDGWANSGKNYKNPAILDNVKAMLGKRTSLLDANISKVENELRVAKGRNKIMLEAQLNDLTNNKTNIEKNLQTLVGDPRSAATFMQRESVINNTVAKFSPLFTESISYKKDDYYWAKKNYELKLAESQRKAAADYEDQVGGVIQTSLGAVTEEDLPAIEKAIDTQFNELSQTINKTTTAIKYQLEQEAQTGNPEAKAQLDLLNKKIKAKTADQTESDVIKEFVADTNYTNNPLLLLDDNGNDLRATLNDAVEQYTLYHQGLKMATKKAMDRQVDKTLNTDKYFEAVNSNKNTKMLWNGRAVPIHEVLKQEDLMDADGNKIGDIKSKPELLKQLQQSYYADAALNKTQKEFNGELRFFNPNDKNLIELARTLQEAPKDILISNRPEGIPKTSDEPELETTYGYRLNPNTKTGRFLAEAYNQGIYDSFSFSDQSLSGDDSTIGDFINEDYKKDMLYIKDLDKFRQKLGNQQQVTVGPSNEVLHQRLVDLAQTKGYFELNKNAVINIMQDGQNIILTQQGKRVGDEITQPGVATIPLSEFQNTVPQLAQQLNFEAKSAIYTYETMGNTPLVSEPIKFVNKTSSDLLDYVSYKTLKDHPGWVQYLTAEDAETSLIRGNAQLANDIENFQPLVNKIVENSSAYSIDIKFTGRHSGNIGLSVILKDAETQEEITASTLRGVRQADDFREILNRAPQAYFGVLIDDIFKRQADALNNYGTSAPEYKKLIKSINSK